MNLDRKKIDKIYSKIDKLSTKGKDYLNDYKKLVDEIVNKGEYAYFESCLSQYYDIGINKFLTVKDVKDKTWDIINLRTNSSFSKKLQKIYNSKNVYQVGYNIYESNDLLGKIVEVEIYTQDTKYLIENRQYAKFKKSIKTYLEVTKVGSYSITINVNNTSLTEDQNLLNRYNLAIDYLKATSSQSEYIDDYVDDYFE